MQPPGVCDDGYGLAHHTGAAVAFGGFMTESPEAQSIRFLFLRFNWPLWLYTIVVALFGALVWLGLGVLRRHRRRVERRQAR